MSLNFVTCSNRNEREESYDIITALIKYFGDTFVPYKEVGNTFVPYMEACSLDLGLLVLQYLHFLIFSAFSHEKTAVG